MPTFRKKPITIEAVQLLDENWDEICEHAGVGLPVNLNPYGVRMGRYGEITAGVEGEGRLGLVIPTLEGAFIANEGDWIIKGVQGEIYPCKPDIFEQTYEPVDVEARRPDRTENH